MKNRYIALIPAAGIGTRMSTTVPKQYLLLHHKPLLYYTILPFYKHFFCEKIVIVLSPEDQQWAEFAQKKIWDEYNQSRVEIIYCGGATRAESVLNGLKHIQNKQWAEPNQFIAVHDAARCCLPLHTLDSFYQTLCFDEIGGIMAIPVVETVKQTKLNENLVQKTIPRETLFLAQTPQMFRFDLLFNALKQTLNTPNISPTDECQALERTGYQPRLVLGHRQNLKVTYPEDIALAAFYLSQNTD